MYKFRLIIVDDDPIWLAQISNSLSFEPDMMVIATASNHIDALELSKKFMPDLAIVEINLFGTIEDKQSALDIAQTIIDELHIKVVILSSVSDEKIFLKAYLKGAMQYVEKKNLDVLPSSIRTCMLSENTINTLLSDYRRLKREELLKNLSYEERQIFEQFENGYSTKEVVSNLYKSKNTIRTQIKSINKKLNSKSILAAISKVRKFDIDI